MTQSSKADTIEIIVSKTWQVSNIISYLCEKQTVLHLDITLLVTQSIQILTG